MTKKYCQQMVQVHAYKERDKDHKDVVPSSTYLVFIKVRSINMSLCNQF